MIERVIGAVHTIGRVLHYGAGVVMIAMMLIVVFNIVGRWIGIGGVVGTVELTALGMVVLVFFGLAHAQSNGDHITVDLLYLRLPRVAKAVVDVFAALVTVGVLAILTNELLQYREILEAGGRETGTLGIPLHPVTWFAVIGTAVYALAVVAMAITAARQGGVERDKFDQIGR